MKIDTQVTLKNFQKAVIPDATAHIVHVGRSDEQNLVDYTLEDWYFSFLSIEDLSMGVLDGTLEPDAVFIDFDADVLQMDRLSDLLKKHEIPFILYTSKFEQVAKERALKLKVDDYLFGALTDSFLRRLQIIKRIKAFKNKKKDKPYKITKITPMQSVKIWRLKRASDIILSSLALMILSPILLLIAIIIKLESKGPIFYISKRAGSGYKIFSFYKFRSMRAGADRELKELSHLNQYSEAGEDTVFFKIKDDPRVTQFGQFLRNTSLDELPQLINVLKGDMSLVGNRPLPLYEAERLTKDQIAWRFLAPAGITGLWQVTKRGQKEMSLDERIHLDVQYAMKNSFMLDMKIIFSTFPALFQKEKV